MKLQILGSNQTVLWFNDGREVFFSYQTPVAAFIPGKGYLRTEKKHSVTTSKHINAWIGDLHAPTMPQSYFDSLIAE